MFKPVTLKGRDELYKFLRDTNISHKKTNKLSSIYYLIKFEDDIFPIYFMKYENSYFESVCCLVENKMTRKELVSYVNDTYDSIYLDDALKYEETMYIDGVHYIIENPQCRPFLDREIKVLDILSERECLDWILRNRKIRIE